MKRRGVWALLSLAIVFIGGAAVEVFVKPFGQKILEDAGAFKDPWKQITGLADATRTFCANHVVAMITVALVAGLILGVAAAGSLRLYFLGRFAPLRRRLGHQSNRVAEDRLLSAAARDPTNVIVVHRAEQPPRLSSAGESFGGRDDTLGSAAWLAALRNLELHGLVTDSLRRAEVYKLTPQGFERAAGLQAASMSSGARSPNRRISSPTR